MKVWYVRGTRVRWDVAGKGVETPEAFGKKDVSVFERDADDVWLRRYGYRSYNAAKRALGVLRWRYKTPCYDPNASIECVEIPDSNLRYRIYRCYEIVIVDGDDNEVGNANYCYGTRKEAEEMAEHELKIAMMEEE